MLVSTSRAGLPCLTQQAWRPPPALSRLSVSCALLSPSHPLSRSIPPRSLTPPSPSPAFPPSFPSLVRTSSLVASHSVDPTCELPPRFPSSSWSNSAPPQSNKEEEGLASTSLHSTCVRGSAVGATRWGFGLRINRQEGYFILIRIESACLSWAAVRKGGSLHAM